METDIIIEECNLDKFAGKGLGCIVFNINLDTGSWESLLSKGMR
jgi:hypothetical protein